MGNPQTEPKRLNPIEGQLSPTLIQDDDCNRPGVTLKDSSTAHFGDNFYYCDSTAVAEQQRIDTLNSLGYTNMGARREQLQAYNDITPEWIWNDKHANGPGYVEWLTNDQRMFWITGKPGSGKSKLMVQISESGRTKSLLSSSQPYTWLVVHFYFTFRASSEISNTLDGLLRHILHQLAAENEAVYQCIRSEKFQRFRDSGYANLHRGQLIELLKGAFETLWGTRKICAFIDGLDEYTGSCSELISTIDLLLWNGSSKICVASRLKPTFLNVSQESLT